MGQQRAPLRQVPAYQMDLIRLGPGIDKNLDYIVQNSSLGWMAARNQQSNRRGTAPVDIGGGVHVGPSMDENLRDFGQIAGHNLAVCLNAIGADVVQQS